MSKYLTAQEIDTYQRAGRDPEAQLVRIPLATFDLLCDTARAYLQRPPITREEATVLLKILTKAEWCTFGEFARLDEHEEELAQAAHEKLKIFARED